MVRRDQMEKVASFCDTVYECVQIYRCIIIVRRQRTHKERFVFCFERVKVMVVQQLLYTVVKNKTIVLRGG